jgi:hypothetical protein
VHRCNNKVSRTHVHAVVAAVTFFGSYKSGGSPTKTSESGGGVCDACCQHGAQGVTKVCFKFVHRTAHHAVLFWWYAMRAQMLQNALNHIKSHLSGVFCARNSPFLQNLQKLGLRSLHVMVLKHRMATHAVIFWRTMHGQQTLLLCKKFTC